MQENESRTVRDTEIRRRLEQIRNCYDVEALQKEASNPQRIASYYRASDFFYNVVHSRGGHVIHMGLSADGVFKKEDFYRQADYVAGLFLPGTRKVLELGAGKAANTKYLAKRFPEISFTALDLPNRNFLRTKVPANVTLIEGDYHDLSRFAAGSFDLVFAVETICHSDRKERVYGEAARILRPGGRLIVFDVFEPKPPAQMTEFDRYVDGIVLGSMSVTEKNQWIGDTLDSLKKSGFSGVSVADLTTEIQPSLERLERYSEKWFSHAKARQFFRRLISEQVTA